MLNDTSNTTVNNTVVDILQDIDLIDVELESLSARKNELSRLYELYSSKLIETQNALSQVTNDLVTRQNNVSIKQRAENMIQAMLDADVSKNAIRMAIITQFGKSKAPEFSLKNNSPKPSSLKEKKITAGLPSQDIQVQILSTIKEKGGSGIRMEELYNLFASSQSDTDKLAVFATVKNAVLDEIVLREGAARGMRYVWAS